MLLGRNMKWKHHVLFSALIVASCANAPAGIEKMSALQVQQVPEKDLCFAYAFSKQTRRQSPVADAEVIRRQLDCTVTVAEVVSDCTKLSILNPTEQPASDESNIYDAKRNLSGAIVSYRIENKSDKSMTFRISWDVRLTDLKNIGPHSSQTYQVPVPSEPEREFLLAHRHGGRAIIPHLQDCVVAHIYP